MNDTRPHNGEEADFEQRGQSAGETEGARHARRATYAVIESMQPARVDAKPFGCPERGQPSHEAVNSSEQFDRDYLNALVEEGINLPTFLDGWCQAMRADLARLDDLRREPALDADSLSGLLHRLCGALGLVGAHNLIEALRHAQTALCEHDCASIDPLAARLLTLVGQLEAVREEPRSARS